MQITERRVDCRNAFEKKARSRCCTRADKAQSRCCTRSEKARSRWWTRSLTKQFVNAAGVSGHLATLKHRRCTLCSRQCTASRSAGSSPGFAPWCTDYCRRPCPRQSSPICLCSLYSDLISHVKNKHRLHHGLGFINSEQFPTHICGTCFTYS